MYRFFRLIVSSTCQFFPFRCTPIKCERLRMSVLPALAGTYTAQSYFYFAALPVVALARELLRSHSLLLPVFSASQATESLALRRSSARAAFEDASAQNSMTRLPLRPHSDFLNLPRTDPRFLQASRLAASPPGNSSMLEVSGHRWVDLSCFQHA